MKKIAFILCLLCNQIVLASGECKKITCVYNPQPQADDVSLPMPGGFNMIFKQVIVPGKEFWGNKHRLIKVGDIEGKMAGNAIFEATQQLPISGSFFDGSNWSYYLGKYELSVGQYVMVMGTGDQSAGLKQFYTLSTDKKLITALKKQLPAIKK